jgi:hypothetical protein
MVISVAYGDIVLRFVAYMEQYIGEFLDVPLLS